MDEENDEHLLAAEGLIAEWHHMRTGFHDMVFPNASDKTNNCIDAVFVAGAYSVACLVRRVFSAAVDADEATRLEASKALMALFEVTDRMVCGHLRERQPRPQRDH